MSEPEVYFRTISCNSQLIKMIEEETIGLVPKPMHSFTIQDLEKTVSKICELIFRYVEKM